LKKHKWLKKYIEQMRWRYGLRDDNGIAEPGDFWYFLIENTRNDSKLAKRLRNDSTNQQNFEGYLLERYGANWLYKSENSEESCLYLDILRNNDRELTDRQNYEKTIDEM
jgi:hypothetical protein